MKHWARNIAARVQPAAGALRWRRMPSRLIRIRSFACCLDSVRALGWPWSYSYRCTVALRTIPDMVKTHGKSQPGSIERRSGNDRRRLESAPPASWERRRAIEPRKPEVAELEMTTSQWDALNDDASLAESRRI
jgi:hypothetical protein